MFYDAFSGLIDLAFQAQAESKKDCDYAVDGILHCGLCGTPKQFWLAVPEDCRQIMGDERKLLPTMCKCRKAAHEAEEEETRRREVEQRLSRMRRVSLMDARLYDATFDRCIVDETNKRAITICRNYAKKFAAMQENSQGMLFYGPPGTGKTFAAACIANELMRRNVLVMMTSFVQLMRHAYNGGDEWFYMLQSLKDASLLIIDDLGAERKTDTALEHVYGIVDDRYRSKKPVIFTSNITRESMQKETDHRLMRIYDRVLETCYPVVFEGVSWRQNEAAKRFEAMRALEEA